MAESSGPFAVLAHIDYPVRRWPAKAGSFDPTVFEEEHRAVLGALARSGRALEVNTRVPLRAEVVGWWYEVGGEAVCFGSDAHAPTAVAHEFTKAAAMVEAQGFRPGRDPSDLWRRRP
jgi:histidinol-phosphatase (PHP family)